MKRKEQMELLREWAFQESDKKAFLLMLDTYEALKEAENKGVI